MTIRNLPPVLEGPDFEEQVASLKATNTLFMPRRGADGYYSLLIYRPKKSTDHNRGQRGGGQRGNWDAGADVVVSLRTRSSLHLPQVETRPRTGRSATAAARPNSRECKCFWIGMGVPPKDGRMIDDDHPEMQKNIGCRETCTDGGSKSTAESNYQRVMENHGWRNENPEPAEVAPREELVLGEGLRCQDCEAVMIRRTLTGPAGKTLDAYFIRAETNETACWIEDHSGGLLPCSSGQHGYWITTQASELQL